jgi:hypothetical protein
MFLSFQVHLDESKFVMLRSWMEKRSAVILAASKMLALPTRHLGIMQILKIFLLLNYTRKKSVSSPKDGEKIDAAHVRLFNVATTNPCLPSWL